VEILSIAPDKPLHQLNTQERKQLRLLLKDFRMRVTGHPSFDDAIVTSGE
jgi:predicted flavoprotein YhiN